MIQIRATDAIWPHRMQAPEYAMIAALHPARPQNLMPPLKPAPWVRCRNNRKLTKCWLLALGKFFSWHRAETRNRIAGGYRFLATCWLFSEKKFRVSSRKSALLGNYPKKRGREIAGGTADEPAPLSGLLAAWAAERRQNGTCDW
jgi:hypothetical protein